MFGSGRQSKAVYCRVVLFIRLRTGPFSASSPLKRQNAVVVTDLSEIKTECQKRPKHNKRYFILQTLCIKYELLLIVP